MTDDRKADALARAEAAEAEAAEAEAVAVAARARAKAIRLRHEADSAVAQASDQDPEPDEDLVAETDDDEDTPDPALSTGHRWRRRPGRRAVVVGAATLVVTALLAVSGGIAWQHHGATRDRERAAEFEAAARQGVVNMTSLDFTKAKDDVGRVLDSSTGEFKDDFRQRADEFTSVVEQSKVITKGTVHYAAVETMNDDGTAVVLVAATSTVTNAAGAKEEPRSWRLSVTMARDGGQLKMAKVEFVP